METRIRVGPCIGRFFVRGIFFLYLCLPQIAFFFCIDEKEGRKEGRSSDYIAFSSHLGMVKRGTLYEKETSRVSGRK